MALTGISTGGTKHPPLKPKTYIARLVQIIDLGEHDEVFKDPQTGEETARTASKLMFTYELPTELIEVKGEKLPRFLSKELTASFSEAAALPTYVKALDDSADLDRNFNLTTLLGKAALVQVGMTKTGNNKIVNSMPLVEGQTAPDLMSKTVVFDLASPDFNVLETLPNFVKNKIKAANNFKHSVENTEIKPIM